MIELILFAGACVLVTLVVRAWRRKERAAFHQVDAQILNDLRQEAGVRADEVSPMQISPGLTPVSPSAHEDIQNDIASQAVRYEPRAQVLDDVRRAFLSRLLPLLAKQGRTGVLVQVPLGAVIRSDQSKDPALRSNVTFVLYRIRDFVPLCVVEIKGSGAQEVSRLVALRNILGTAGLPLVEFPMLDRYAPAELVTELRRYI